MKNTLFLSALSLALFTPAAMAETVDLDPAEAWVPALSGDLPFIGAVIYSGYTHGPEDTSIGAALDNRGNITWRGVGSVEFSDNSAENGSRWVDLGAPLHRAGVFSGAVYNEGDLYVERNGSVEFSGNSAIRSESGGYYMDFALASAILNTSTGTVSLSGNQNCTFAHNTAAGNINFMAAIFNSGVLEMNGNKTLSFIDNQYNANLFGNLHHTASVLVNYGTTTMCDNELLLFQDNGSGVVDNVGTMLLRGNKVITFENNSNVFTSANDTSISIEDSGDITHTGGGRFLYLYNGARFNISRAKSVTFSNNVDVDNINSGLLAVNTHVSSSVLTESSLTLENIGTLSFTDNTSTGCIYNEASSSGEKSTVVLRNNGDVIFENNHGYIIHNYCSTRKFIRAVVLMEGNKNVRIEGNTKEGGGDPTYGGPFGVIDNRGLLSIRGNGSFTLANNSSSGSAVCISDSSGIVDIHGNGKVVISGNSAVWTHTSYYEDNPFGGAMHNSLGIMSIGGNDSVVFEKNYDCHGGQYTLRSITGSSVSLAADQGKNVTIKDSIAVGTLGINRYYGDNGQWLFSNGDVVFTGESTEADLAEIKGEAGTAEEIANSRLSAFTYCTVYGGRLIVKDQAKLKVSARIDTVAGTGATLLVEHASAALGGVYVTQGNSLQVINGSTASFNNVNLTDGEFLLDSSTISGMERFAAKGACTLQLAGGSTLRTSYMTMDNAELTMNIVDSAITVERTLTLEGNNILNLTSDRTFEDGERVLLMYAGSRSGSDLLLTGMSGSLEWEGRNLYYTHAAAHHLGGMETQVAGADDFGAGSVVLDATTLDLNGQAVQNNLVVEGDSTLSSASAYAGIIEVNGGILSLEGDAKAKALVLNHGGVSGDGLNAATVILKDGVLDSSLTNSAAKVKKVTDGTVHLTRANAMAETEVGAGTLVLDADGATGGADSTVGVVGKSATLVNNGTEVLSAVSATDGATVQGTGTFANLRLVDSTLKVGDTAPMPNLMVMRSGALSPEETAKFEGRIGVTTVGTLVLNGSTLAMDITRLADGTAYNDVLAITESLTATAVGTLELTLLESTAWEQGESLTFSLFDVSALSGEALDNAFAALRTKLTITLSNVPEGVFSIDSRLGTNGSVTLTALTAYNQKTPEPTTTTLALLALASLVSRRRRRVA